VKLFELPGAAQEMIGAGRTPVSSVGQLRAIGAVSGPLLDALIAYLAAGNEWAAERLAREPGWVLDSALRANGERKVFPEHLTSLHPYTLQELQLGKRTDALLEEIAELAQKLDRYSYGLPEIRFSDEDVDQARAAGVVIELERHAARGMTFVMPP
jgi:hypothetical protein